MTERYISQIVGHKPWLNWEGLNRRYERSEQCFFAELGSSGNVCPRIEQFKTERFKRPEKKTNI